jgi:hypothetical protein
MLNRNNQTLCVCKIERDFEIFTVKVRFDTTTKIANKSIVEKKVSFRSEVGASSY